MADTHISREYFSPFSSVSSINSS